MIIVQNFLEDKRHSYSFSLLSSMEQSRRFDPGLYCCYSKVRHQSAGNTFNPWIRV